jgi:hypothetical protein
MKLSEVKNILLSTQTIGFKLPNNTYVPSHFHVTEVGLINKKYIDCGGTIRNETVVSFQLWEADDYDHRLEPLKFLSIIELSEKVLQIEDLDVEVEYQAETIGKYDLEFDGNDFVLVSKTTDCLAKDKCGIPTTKPKLKLADIKLQNCCTPNNECC